MKGIENHTCAKMIGPKTTMVMIAVQCGLQSFVYQFCNAGGQLKKLEFVIITCFAKICLCLGMLAAQGELGSLLQALPTTFKVALPPAVISGPQNVFIVMGLASVNGMTFTLLSQTKIIWAALGVWLLLGRRLVLRQWISIFLLVATGVIITLEEAGASGIKGAPFIGCVCVLMASFCSGLSSTLSERALHGCKRSSFVFTIELSMCEIVLVFFILFVELTSGIALTGDATKIRQFGLFGEITPFSLVPAWTQAIGGILVGWLTKITDGVAKSYAMVLAVMLSSMIDVFSAKKIVTVQLVVALCLGVIAMWMNFESSPLRRARRSSIQYLFFFGRKAR